MEGTPPGGGGRDSTEEITLFERYVSFQPGCFNYQAVKTLLQAIDEGITLTTPPVASSAKLDTFLAPLIAFDPSNKDWNPYFYLFAENGHSSLLREFHPRKDFSMLEMRIRSLSCFFSDNVEKRQAFKLFASFLEKLHKIQQDTYSAHHHAIKALRWEVGGVKEKSQEVADAPPIMGNFPIELVRSIMSYDMSYAPTSSAATTAAAGVPAGS